MHPGVIVCSPPKTNGKILFFKFSSLIFEICFKALTMFLSILNGFKVFIPIFLYGSQFSSSSYNSTWCEALIISFGPFFVPEP